MNTALTEILLADDDDADVMLMERAFRQAEMKRKVLVARDGQDAMEQLAAREHAESDRLPALVILDVKMPRRDGLQTLQWIRAQPALRCIPVFMLSSSSHHEDVERAYLYGANGYFVKPVSTVHRAELAKFFDDWIRLNQPPLAVSEGYKAAFVMHSTRLK
jgi:CheY-like chemotaxis protein